ncbi:TetR/AcrR family transcriptional regulator [Mycobacterium sp. E796]|uniref:TetR/AcrR family transcriptional regulator n=1 Tax=Mycobacterium sp. E796 TaxID=1834151 RepID=UPI0008008C07|nr:TetR/AcrR family transcriptional regulator [Mycobacterium sp. E796]OBI54744.1 TetR family transcriptional regulator [Mycobacterium sp. E796]
MGEPTNLHKLRHSKTHEALRQVALKRFASEGFGNVTVQQLAQEAGVTERTFFRHFPTKEAVLFQDYDTHVEWLAEALTQRPQSESVFDAVLASMASYPHDIEVVRQAALARAELITGEQIASHLRVVQSSFAAVITDFVKQRYPDVENIELVANVAGATLAAAMVIGVETWGRNGCVEDLAVISATCLELVRSGLSPLT